MITGEKNLSETSDDLRDLVSTTIDRIREGLKGKDCAIAGSVKFELAVVKMKEAKGGFRFFIAEAGGNYSSQNTSKITFEVVATKIAQGIRFPLLWFTEQDR